MDAAFRQKLKEREEENVVRRERRVLALKRVERDDVVEKEKEVVVGRGLRSLKGLYCFAARRPPTREQLHS